MTKNPDRDIVVLYIEDVPDIGESFFEFLTRNYSARSKWARSQEAALGFFLTGFRPNLVIHDCSPMQKESSVEDSLRAGDQLYREYAKRGLPVVVLTGKDIHEAQTRPPYSTHPPLGWLPKPTSEDVIRRAIEMFKASDAAVAK
jgi:CheY-like chemotaxis protein